MRQEQQLMRHIKLHAKKIDSKTLLFLRQNSNLFLAIVAIILFIWSICYHDVLLLIQLVGSAILGYATGFVPGILFDFLLGMIRFERVHFDVVQQPFPFFQFFLCAYIVWLAYRHQQMTILIKKDKKADKVVTW